MDKTENIRSHREGIDGKTLTTRQEEILIALSSGERYRQIARKTGITEGTLKVSMWRLMNVTGKNRTELALIGYQLARRRADGDGASL